MRDSSKTRAQQATTRAIAVLIEKYAGRVEPLCAAVTLYGDFEAAQAFVDRIVKSRWFAKRFPSVYATGAVLKPLETNENVDRSGWSWESIALRRMKFKTSLFPMLLMPAWALDELMILHVLAHACAGDAHGRDWARTFLNLTAHVLGKKRAEVLRAEFRNARVRWHRRPVLSEEARGKLRERGKKLQENFRARNEIEYGGGGA